MCGMCSCFGSIQSQEVHFHEQNVLSVKNKIFEMIEANIISSCFSLVKP